MKFEDCSDPVMIIRGPHSVSRRITGVYSKDMHSTAHRTVHGHEYTWPWDEPLVFTNPFVGDCMVVLFLRWLADGALDSMMVNHFNSPNPCKNRDLNSPISYESHPSSACPGASHGLLPAPCAVCGNTAPATPPFQLLHAANHDAASTNSSKTII